ncbi:ATP-dependent RNA helicase HrpA [Gynuella sp.]|uniref:ATP-dependent RNA helicase HrpA n=1 Tax=Gynuella sp. TaxID=2969146 RepID=UPI003D1319DF
MVQETLQKLISLLDSVACKDRYFLQQEVNKLSALARNKKDVTAGLEKLITRFDQSIGWVQQRIQNRPAITIDPDLPIGQKSREIADLVAQHQVVVLAGETGSGKTTQLPKICLQLGRGQKGLIGHTQPRRLAARAVASRIAEEMQVPLGGLVGFQVRFQDQIQDSTQVKVMTDGILLAEIQKDRYLNKYDTIIIDEAHERSLNIDFLLGYIKRLLPRRPDLKLIITSATIDLERFSKHFDNAPIIEVSGRTYPVHMVYRPLGSEEEDDQDFSYRQDLSQAIVTATEEILELERTGQTPGKGGDILVFLPGEREIREAANALRKSSIPHLEVLPLYARLSAAEQQRIFSSHSGRRIVLSTNVAETSLTVPGIGYVIDPGLARISRYSYRSKVQRLPIEKISQASANQRAGRCGRVSEGMCIRLYSEEDFNNRPAFTDAEIMRTNLASVILQMLYLRLGEIEKFPFVDMPDSRFVKDGYTLLNELGAVTVNGQLSKLGLKLARLPLDPRLARMLLEAHQQKSLREVLIIVSAMAIQDPRERPQEKQQQAQQKHAQDADKDSDFLSLINLWNRYEQQRLELSQNQLRKYCEQNFLHYLRMREWRDTHRQLHLACKELGLVENESEAGYQQIHGALLSGLLSQIAAWKEERQYTAARGRACMIHPGSSVSKKRPKWIMAGELVETSQLFARMVARIEPEWIEPLARSLVKKQYFEPHWEQKRAQVIAQEQVSLYGLIIIGKRRVHYGAVDPVVSREIFIRSALVENHYQTRAAFYAHNGKLIDEILQMEAKSRRHEYLVDDQVLFEFYDQHIPEGIVNGSGFEHWLKQKGNDRLLYLTRETLLRKDGTQLGPDQFPEVMDLGGIYVPVNYEFKLGSEADGVSIRLPVEAINQVSAARIQWLVPGMLREKCIALVKALPKSLRKNFVPVPDFIDAALPNLVFGDGDLCDALAHQLLRMTGVKIPRDQWDTENIESHLKLNIQVINQHGKIIRQGRNLEELRSIATELPISPSASQKRAVEKHYFTDFPDRPLAREELVKRGGIQVKVFPALQYSEKGVALEMFNGGDYAECQHELALIQLLRMNFRSQEDFLKQDLRNFKQLELVYAPIGNAQQFRHDLMTGVFKWTFIEPWKQQHERLPRNEQEWDALKKLGSGEINNVGKEVAQLVFDILKARTEILKSTRKKVNFVLAFMYADIKSQLENLTQAGFVARTPKHWLQQYPRYIQAIHARMDRSKGVPANEQLMIDELADWWQKYSDLDRKLEQEQRVNEDLNTFRWLIEEYRISLFAQTIGTIQPVSDKRLSKLWQSIIDQVG